MTHIMLDLETWGTIPGCDIRSIGACWFKPNEAWVAPRQSHGGFYLATEDGSAYGLTKDASTIKWWSEQSEEAQGAFNNPVNLAVALEAFNRWITTIHDGESSDLRIWAHGPHFDVSIIEVVYRATGVPIPWSYRSPRDTRTIMEAAGIASMELFVDDDAVYHHALDDALCQARAVCAAHKVLQCPSLI